MKFKHVVVWLDRLEAHVIHFDRDSNEEATIKERSHHKFGMGAHGNLAEHTHYLDEIATAVADAEEILIVGPGLEKLVLAKHLLKHHHAIGERVLGVESVDHPSNGQLLAYARKYFHRVDQLL